MRQKNKKSSVPSSLSSCMTMMSHLNADTQLFKHSHRVSQDTWCHEKESKEMRDSSNYKRMRDQGRERLEEMSLTDIPEWDILQANFSLSIHWRIVQFKRYTLSSPTDGGDTLRMWKGDCSVTWFVVFKTLDLESILTDLLRRPREYW